MRSIVSLTARSLPGIGVAEKITVSPSCSSTCGWSPWAMRRSAESGSPWLPVEITTSLWSGKSSISLAPTSIPSGTSMWPSLRPMFTFLRIERPTSETLRPSAAAASTTCCTRWMFEAKQVTTMRPLAARERPPRAAARRSTPTATCPARSALVESPHSSSRPSRPELGEPRDVGGHAVHRRLVELVVAGDQRRAELAGQRHGERVRDRVGHLHHLDLERPGLEASRRPSTSSTRTSLSRCSSSFERTIATVSGPP